MKEQEINDQFNELKNAIYSLSVHDFGTSHLMMGSLLRHNDNIFFYNNSKRSDNQKWCELEYNDNVTIALHSKPDGSDPMHYIGIMDKFDFLNDNKMVSTKVKYQISLYNEKKPSYLLLNTTEINKRIDISEFTEEEMFQFSLLNNISTDYKTLKGRLQLFDMIRDEFKNDKVIRSLYDIITIIYHDELPLNTEFRMY